MDELADTLGLIGVEKYGLHGLVIGFVLILIMPQLALVVLICTAALFTITGFITLTYGGDKRKPTSHIKQETSISNTNSAPITNEPTIADRIREIHQKNDFKCPSCGAIVSPTDIKCKHCDSILVDMVNLPRPQTWADVEIGQAVQLKHPVQGEMSLSVQNRMYFGELWQAQMRSDVPWTLTGSYYVGLKLNENILLLNWQNRFYLLDLESFLTDMDINHDFAPYARKFAASNQTKEVYFTYKDIMWTIQDIGRFRIEFAEGDGIKVSPGVVGRFIHLIHKNQALVVQDYQTGGGGLDRSWQGYQIAEQDIQF